MLLFILLFLITGDYIGLGALVPAYKALPFVLVFSNLILLYLLTQNKPSEFLEYKPALYTLIFILLTGFAGVHGLIKSYAIPPLKVQIGFFVYMYLCAYLITNIKQFRLFTLVFTLTHAILVIVNMDKLGGARIGMFQGGYFLGDGNDFGWSQNVAFPLAIHLAFTTKNHLFKYAYTGLAVIILIGIIGTQSRGSFLAFAAGMLYYLNFISSKKIVGFLLIGVIGIGLLAFSPSGFFSRMGTIVDYEEDTSAMGRIKAWRTATEMAIDNPILGVGAGSFNSSYGRFYRKADDPARWISTHSVYFKVLAEYGFPGILIFLLSIYHTLKLNRDTERLIKEKQNRLEITPFWPQCVNWATISWAICAMFLTGYIYPHLFILMGLSIAVHRMALKEIENSDEPEDKKPTAAPRPQYFS
jgi:probable O-glycosylation ligase (exosortase A-associated)